MSVDWWGGKVDGWVGVGGCGEEGAGQPPAGGAC